MRMIYAEKEGELTVRPLLVGDFDVWYQPCRHCGYDPGKSKELDNPRCWKCGRPIQRDFSDRALKKSVKAQQQGIANDRKAT